MKSFNWDDLRVFLAVARAHSAFDAAPGIGMNQSTVSRRLQRLEEDMGSKLFDRSSRGHRLTSAGLRLLEHVERLETTLFDMESATFGDSLALTGDIRIWTTEVFGSFFLAPHMAHFCTRHPSIKIDLLPMPRNVNLSRREADMSVTLERPVADHCVTSSLLEYRMVPYATTAYLQRSGPVKTVQQLAAHRWIDYVDDLLFSDQQPSLKQFVPAAIPFFRSSSMTAQFQAVRAGLGIAILPCFLASSVPDLVPVLAEEINITRKFWLAAPAERRELARVRAVWDYLREVADANADFLMGRASANVWLES